MELVRWNPWHDMRRFRNSVPWVFDNLHDTERSAVGGRDAKGWHPAVDVYETADAYVLNAELPGMKKEDIDIDVKDRILTLRGERRWNTEAKDERFHRKERVFGRFQRSFALPEGVVADSITAELKNGVLKICIPRPEEKKPRQITVH